jgi:hypothetical protein
MIGPSLSDAQILQSAIVCTAVNSSMPLHVQNIGLILPLVRSLNDSFYVVYWPNGVAALANGDPAEKISWNALLLSTYRQAEAGLTGPLAGALT